jgi:DNA repair exonuclease SbcCD ATPase subunit
MDTEQMLKQLDWLDEERRKDKSRLSALEERLAALEGNVAPLSHQIKEVGGEITRLSAMFTRMDQFDENLLQQRVETKQYFEELERQFKQSSEESEKVRRVEMRAVDNNLAELRKELEPIPELKRNLKARVEEEHRLGRSIDEVRGRIETVRRSEEEYTRTYRLLDDGRRQDAKRLTDLQGEMAAIRKRVDEQRGRVELISSTTKKLETRLNEIAVVETERREAQAAFLEDQALRQVERDRVWKEWQARFEIIEAQTADIESNLQTLDATHRAVKRTQQTVDELAQKVERRINEITEIQRLGEERFRQEWVTFKADDQKRWTNYTLTIEEQRGESIRQYEKLAERVTRIEDSIQEVQDLLQLMNEQSEKRLQSLLATAHEWVSTYENTLGRTR